MLAKILREYMFLESYRLKNKQKFLFWKQFHNFLVLSSVFVMIDNLLSIASNKVLDLKIDQNVVAGGLKRMT